MPNNIISAHEVIPYNSFLMHVSNYINNQEDLAMLEKAYHYAVKYHAPQIRKSGEPYVNHVINVAIILAKLQVSPNVIAAGFLHDVVEDCDVSVEQIKKDFNEDISIMVQAVTKLGNLPTISAAEYQAENHRKIFIAMSKDIRVILVKLADRLHNMLTLNYMSLEKQQRIAQETLDVYAPIAHRLGLAEIKATLEDKCLYYLDQQKYFEIVDLVDLKKQQREVLVEDMIKEIDSILVNGNIIVHISGRSKHLYSIYKKMVYKNKTFDEIYDLQAIRIICKDVLECYAILGIIHSQYRPIPGRFKDYIAMQKPNMYQSLHTTIIGIQKSIFEIQIRTQGMDEIAERGFAAHWRYKEGNGKISNQAIEEQLHWFRDFVSLSDQGEDLKAKEYMSNLTRDIFEANIHALTPKGKVVSLPKDSCIIDFAYKIHSKVAESMSGALVNNHFVPFNYKLKTGDVVEIKTQKNATGPSVGWLDLVKTSNARQRIKHFLKMKNEAEHKEIIDKGRIILHKYLKENKLDEKKYQNAKTMDKCIKNFKLQSFDDIYMSIAEKSLDIVEVVNYMYDIKQKMNIVKFIKKDTNKKVNKTQANGIIVEGIDEIAVELSKCCNPIPGDEIVGYISSGKAIKVHRSDCHNVQGLKSKGIIDVAWDPTTLKGKQYFVDIQVHVFDRVYLLSDIVTALSQINVMVTSMDSVINDLEADIFLNIRIENGTQLKQVYANIKKIDSVIDVIRVNK